MTSSSEDSFVLIEETSNILHDDDIPVIIDCDDVCGEHFVEKDQSQSSVLQIMPLKLKTDFVSILETKKIFPTTSPEEPKCEKLYCWGALSSLFWKM